MPMIETTDDLLRLLDENEEFLTAVRGKILTDDLLRLPEEFAKFVAASNARFGAVESRLDKLEETVAALVLNAEATNNRLDGIDNRLDGVDNRLDGIDNRLDGIEVQATETNNRLDGIEVQATETNQRLDGIHQSLDRFRGNYASEGAWNNRREIVQLFADTNRAGRPRLKTFTDEELDDMLDENLEVIDALEEEGDVLARFGRADLIVLAERRRTREPLYWVVAEASYTIDAGDIVRASDNAKFLRAATGQNAYAIVVGVQTDPQIEEKYGERIIYDLEQFLKSDRDDVVYWYELTETSAQPRPPR